MYEYDDGEEGGRSTGRLIGAIVGVIVIVALGWFVVRPALSGDDDATDDTTGPTLTDSAASERPTTVAPDADVIGPSSSDVVDESDEPETTDVSTTARPAPTTTEAATVTAAPTTVAATTAPSVVATAAPPAAVTYDTLPDGTPVPVLALFDVSQITLAGAVPDQAAVDRLSNLALAYAKPGQGTIVNFLTINPDVPPNVGVRVVELTSVRFPEGSSEILPDHARELDRVAAVMSALPHVTTLVVGHADQRGDDLTNFARSEERARNVVNYLVGAGVAPDRLSSRAVGEADLISLNNDDAALALNRRTEFILYGLLLGQ